MALEVYHNKIKIPFHTNHKHPPPRLLLYNIAKAAHTSITLANYHRSLDNNIIDHFNIHLKSTLGLQSNSPNTCSAQLCTSLAPHHEPSAVVEVERHARDCNWHTHIHTNNLKRYVHTRMDDRQYSIVPNFQLVSTNPRTLEYIHAEPPEVSAKCSFWVQTFL